MKKFVLDCSVSAAWRLKDEHSEKAQVALKALSNAEAIVPSLWAVEMALVAERKGRIKPADAAREVELILKLPIAMAPEDNRTTLEDTRRVGPEHGLSAYDACYLALALRTGLPLATLDKVLTRAARSCGVQLL
ncbi:MAG: hypothetical protein A2151_01760 [Candidatus Muproteobacteria bacterium RBG_16_65_34]|uniref:Ribonuclease VapC n=1 Tax=Candidatus Muproteobacteria bacterium RBG_16_65_34 TaxID=1817760 RepID=A0A1F6TR59_9PROT|nr:MAG: hypothetical protein A2151_01760 [Candidatus Muproteobacteria bacterium RBG_16_65_34]